MSLPDLVNSLYECFGFVAISMSCWEVYRAKRVSGVSIITVIFFTSWGFWNLYYYPSLGQTLSGVGAGLTCIANVTWVWLILKYKKA